MTKIQTGDRMEWDESKHPRDWSGKFTDGTTDYKYPQYLARMNGHEGREKNGIELSPQEYGALRAEVMRKNIAQSGKVKPTNFAFTSNYFYIYSTTGDDSFTVVEQLDIETHHEKIKAIIRKML